MARELEPFQQQQNSEYCRQEEDQHWQRQHELHEHYSGKLLAQLQHMILQNQVVQEGC